MSFHGNQIGHGANFTGKNILLTFQMERFEIILSMTTRFYTNSTQNLFKMKFSIFVIKVLISPLILA